MKSAEHSTLDLATTVPAAETTAEAAQPAVHREHAARMSSKQPPIRILHVFNAIRRAGTEMGVLKIAQGLAEERFDHRLCTMWGYDKEFLELQGLKGKVSVAGYFDEQRHKLSRYHLRKLIRIMRQHRPHIVHTRNWGTVEAILAARLTGVPIVVHSEHGHNADTTLSMSLRRRILRRCLYAMTDALFAVSQELRDFHAQAAWMSPDRIHVIYNGVDSDRFAPCPELRLSVRARHGIPAAPFLVGYVGRIEAGKDLPTLFAAVKALLDCGQDLHVVAVGQGFLLTKYLEEIRKDTALRDRVTFIGPSDEVPQLLNALDAFVLPSLGEGLSNTLLEAMASGLPVVATRVGGTPEVVEDGQSGLLFAPRDVAALTGHLERLMKDNELRGRLGRAARTRVVTRFSLEAMIENYRKFYLGVASQRGLRAGR